ncbi:MAG: tetratricopeptide repeat protein, partial [Spirochaetota bacterium]
MAVVVGTSAAAQSDAPELVREGNDALATGRYFEAIQAYQEALEANPNYLEAVVGLAESYYWLEEYDQADRHVSTALRLARSNPRVINLGARVAIGLGQLGEAESAFRRVQELEPNNVDSTIGLAELALARGQSAEAVSRLERALRLNPDQRKALLSLILIYEHLGEDEIARDYLEIARSVHRGRPEVHVLAAEYFVRSGDYEEAARAARTAQAIDPMSRAATAIRAEIALLGESYLEAATIAEELIASSRQDVRAWYLRAVAKHRLGEIDDALTSIRTALRIAPDNETLRIWAEWLAMEELDLESETRAELSAVRAADAAALERGFRYERAMKTYRRALQLAPLDTALRRRYAELFRKMGYQASYLQELRVLRDNGIADSEIERSIEVYENALSSSVAARWGIDQFTIDRDRTPISIALVSLDAYPRSDRSILSFIRRTVQGLGAVDVVHAAPAASYSEAFSAARASEADYFLQLAITATEEMFTVSADVHVGRTGSRAHRLSVVRTGPDNAAAATDAFADEIVRLLPSRGEIIARRGRSVVVDLGSRHGV